jgi:hypothetical protein
VYLFGSALIAFIAAVLDLGQVLARGVVDTNLGTDMSSVKPLIIVREFGFAISVGLRFLFFWTIVADRPAHESCDEDGHHSGSWERWGLGGHVLKWGLLLISNAIPILQVVWRVDGTFSNFNPLYDTESSMEIVASALFICKLLLNISISPLVPRWKVLRRYLPLILALAFSTTVAVGNVICCAYTWFLCTE